MFLIRVSVFGLTLLVLGCGQSADKPAAKPDVKSDAKPSAEVSPKEAKIQAALAKLDEKDRVLAEAQKYCVIQTKSRLGSMGPPEKITIKGETVFLCCESCKEDAEANAEKTLATMHELQAKNKAGK